MRKMKFALVALLVVPAFAACASTEEIVQNDTKEYTTQYRGADLYCVGQAYDRSLALSCDFERFYSDNPMLAR